VLGRSAWGREAYEADSTETRHGLCGRRQIRQDAGTLRRHDGNELEVAGLNGTAQCGHRFDRGMHPPTHDSEMAAIVPPVDYGTMVIGTFAIFANTSAANAAKIHTVCCRPQFRAVEISPGR